MKKNISNVLFILLFILSAFNNPVYNPCYDGKKISFSEDTLNLDAYIKNGSEVEVVRHYFKSNMRCGLSWKDLDQQSLQIQMIHLINWSKPVRDKPVLVSCFKIYYGFDKKNKIIPLFQLGRLIKKIHVPGKSHEYKYTAEFNYPTCMYSLKKGFFTISDTLKDSLIKNYNDSIFIRHRKIDPPNVYTKVSGSAGSHSFESDPRAIIFSFQEVFTFYDMTLEEDETSSSSRKYCHSLYLHHVMDNFHSLMPGSWPIDRFKHSILFSRKKDIDQVFLAGLKVLIQSDKAANLAHLSPPNDPNLNFEIK